MNENILPMPVEINKECITGINKQAIINYYLVNFDSEQPLTLEHLEMIRDFLDEYVKNELSLYEK